MTNPSISVIVPAFNEEKYIEPTLQSVSGQGYHGLELIVVPNGCTDKTADVAARFTRHVFDTTRRGISIAKNIGYEKATGDLVVFLDADTQMQQGLLATIAETLSERYIGGKTKVLPDDGSFGARTYFGYVNFCGHLSQALAHISPRLNNGAGACIFGRREELDYIRQREGYIFREDLKAMEDVDLISRIRAQGPFKFLTKRGVITSTRRFRNEGYLKRFFMDFVEFLDPEGVQNRRDIR